MSNINDIVRSAQGGQVFENLSDRLGLASWQTEAAVRALIPALSSGLQKAAEDPASLRLVIAAANDPTQRFAFENAEFAHSEAAVESGGALVDHLFGSPATVGQIAQLASRESGVRADIIQQILPVLASIVAGGLADTLHKQGRGSVLGQIADPSAAAEAVETAGSAEAETPQRQAGGALAFLTGIVATLFGGKPASRPSAESASAAASKSGGSDADALQETLDQLRAAFAPGASVSADHEASLDELLGQAPGPQKG